MRCLLLDHKWLYWRQDANYRFCTRCPKWQHLEFYSNRTQTWVDCQDPKDEVTKDGCISFKDKSGTNIISMTNNGNGTVDISFGDKFKVSGSPILDVKALANALRIVSDKTTKR